MFGREQTKESEYFNVNDMGNQEFRVLSTKLAHLGYSYPLAKNCVPLVNAILQDLELSMKKLQDAQNENSRAKKEMGVLLAENSIHKKNLVNLRNDNNQLRAQVLQANHDLEQTKFTHKKDIKEVERRCEILLINNTQLKENLKASINQMEDERRVINERIKYGGTRIKLKVGWLEGNNEMLRLLENTKKVEQSRKEFKNLDLLTVQQARINSLQEEVEVLKAKHTDFVNEIELNQRQLEARDIEILSLNNQIRRDEAKNKKYAAGGGGGSSQETVEAREKRLHDQLEYVQEYADDVEKEKKEIAAAYEDEKDTLRRKLTECREQIENLKRDLAKESGGGEGKKGSFGGTVVADGGSGKGENNVVESTYTSMDNIQPSFQEIKENVNLLVKNMEFRILTLTQSLERMIKEKMYYTGESEEINNIKKELKEIRTVMMQIKNVYLEAGQTRVEFELREKNKTLDSELQVTKQELSNLQSLYRQVDEQLKYERVKLAEQTLKQDSKGVAMPKQEEGVGASKLDKESELIGRLTTRVGELEELTKSISVGKVTELKKENEGYRDYIQELKREFQMLKNMYNSLLTSYNKVVNNKQSRFEREMLDKKVADQEQALKNMQELLAGHSKLCEEQHIGEINRLKTENSTLSTNIEMVKLREKEQIVENNRLKGEFEGLKYLNKALEMSKNEYKQQLGEALNENKTSMLKINQLVLDKEMLTNQVKSIIHNLQRVENKLQRDDDDYNDDYNEIYQLPSMRLRNTKRMNPTENINLNNPNNNNNNNSNNSNNKTGMFYLQDEIPNLNNIQTHNPADLYSDDHLSNPTIKNTNTISNKDHTDLGLETNTIKPKRSSSFSMFKYYDKSF